MQVTVSRKNLRDPLVRAVPQMHRSLSSCVLREKSSEGHIDEEMVELVKCLLNLDH